MNVLETRNTRVSYVVLKRTLWLQQCTIAGSHTLQHRVLKRTLWFSSGYWTIAMIELWLQARNPVQSFHTALRILCSSLGVIKSRNMTHWSKRRWWPWWAREHDSRILYEGRIRQAQDEVLVAVFLCGRSYWQDYGMCRHLWNEKGTAHSVHGLSRYSSPGNGGIALSPDCFHS